MINIYVWSNKTVSIEGESDITIETREDLVKLLETILNKAYYSGERLMLGIGDVIESKNGASPSCEYHEIDRWT